LEINENNDKYNITSVELKCLY